MPTCRKSSRLNADTTTRFVRTAPLVIRSRYYCGWCSSRAASKSTEMTSSSSLCRYIESPPIPCTRLGLAPWRRTTSYHYPVLRHAEAASEIRQRLLEIESARPAGGWHRSTIWWSARCCRPARCLPTTPRCRCSTLAVAGHAACLLPVPRLFQVAYAAELLARVASLYAIEADTRGHPAEHRRQVECA